MEGDPMKRGAHDHPKMGDLAARLGIEWCHANGIMERLWQYAQRYSPRGDIGRFNDYVIADAVKWKGDPAALVGALVEARWLDRHPEFRLVIHDWADHCDEYVHRDVALAGELFVCGREPKLRKLSPDEKRRATEARERKLRQNGAPHGAIPAPQSSAISGAQPGAVDSATPGAHHGAIAAPVHGAIVPPTRPGQARPGPTRPSQPSAGAEDLRSDTPPAAPSTADANPDPPGLAGWQIFENLASLIRGITSDQVELARLAGLVRDHAAAGIHPYFFDLWLREFAESKRAKGTKVGVGLIFTAAAKDFRIWLRDSPTAAMVQEANRDPADMVATTRDLCNLCSAFTIRFGDGTIVPCNCRPKPLAKVERPGAAALAIAARSR
jgi:hypothetical protein